MPVFVLTPAAKTFVFLLYHLQCTQFSHKQEFTIMPRAPSIKLLPGSQLRIIARQVESTKVHRSKTQNWGIINQERRYEGPKYR